MHFCKEKHRKSDQLINWDLYCQKRSLSVYFIIVACYIMHKVMSGQSVMRSWNNWYSQYVPPPHRIERLRVITINLGKGSYTIKGYVIHRFIVLLVFGVSWLVYKRCIPWENPAREAVSTSSPSSMGFIRVILPHSPSRRPLDGLHNPQSL